MLLKKRAYFLYLASWAQHRLLLSTALTAMAAGGTYQISDSGYDDGT